MIERVEMQILLDLIAPDSVSDDLVTVCVSLYNYASFVEECFESIAAQRHENLELIVVDDASSKDESVVVARNWLSSHADRFKRVLLLRHKRNQGLAQARNTGFSEARGEFVFVIDADNTIYPRAIGRLFEIIVESRSSAAYSQLEHFGAEQRIGFADVFDRDSFRKGNYVDAMALVSRSAWKAVGGYTHLEGGWEDYDFWCKFVDNGLAAIYLPEILCRYRVHSTSMLRTETASSYDALITEMIMRHPWLELSL